jgi:hypothetical protein
MRSVYRQTRERTSQALAWTALLCLVLTTGGCMNAGPMASFMAEDDVTGSISTPGAGAAPLPLTNPDDWAPVRAALAQALDPQGGGAVATWENPGTGARGSILPVGAVYEADGQMCRAFVAEIDGKAPARRLQGRGCRGVDGQWTVSDLKPFGS